VVVEDDGAIAPPMMALLLHEGVEVLPIGWFKGDGSA
jgi:hypothetical protein